MIRKAAIKGSGWIAAYEKRNVLIGLKHGLSGRAQIGRDGDFFTSVSVGPLFGALIAHQIAELWERLPPAMRGAVRGMAEAAIGAPSAPRATSPTSPSSPTSRP